MMAATWTRGQLWDKIVEQAQKNPKYCEMLKSDPRGLMEKQLGTAIPETVNIKVLEETADTYYIVLPAFAKEGGELSDADLEKVAGGGTVKGDATCTGGHGSIGTTVVDVTMGMGF
jgi:predicted ATP-dependent serine protease